VALLRKITCKLRHPMGLRHPVWQTANLFGKSKSPHYGHSSASLFFAGLFLQVSFCTNETLLRGFNIYLYSTTLSTYVLCCAAVAGVCKSQLACSYTSWNDQNADFWEISTSGENSNSGESSQRQSFDRKVEIRKSRLCSHDLLSCEYRV